MRIYCSACATSLTEVSDELGPGSRFTCRTCLPKGDARGGRRLDTARDPWFPRAHSPEGTSSPRPRPAEQELSWGEFAHEGFHVETQKAIAPGLEWSGSDSFLREMLANRTREEMGRALVLICGRWRQCKTFLELAIETGQPVEGVRKALSALRTEGNRLWEKKQRAEAKAVRNAQLSTRARGLFERGLTVRQVAKIMAVSVGFASELRRAA